MEPKNSSEESLRLTKLLRSFNVDAIVVYVADGTQPGYYLHDHNDQPVDYLGKTPGAAAIEVERLTSIFKSYRKISDSFRTISLLVSDQATQQLSDILERHGHQTNVMYRINKNESVIVWKDRDSPKWVMLALTLQEAIARVECVINSADTIDF